MKERNINIDIIRCVAISFVILHHCWSMLGYSSSDFGWRSYTSRYGQIGVALFVMISGALLLTKIQNIRVFFRKRISRILIPFCIFATIVYFLSILTHKYEDVHSCLDAFRNFLPYLFENKINMAYWYIFLIFGLYLITPFLQRALHSSEDDGKQLLHFGLGLWLCLSIIENFYPQCEFFKLYSFGADDFIGFFLAGYYFVHYFTYKSQYKWLFVSSFIVCAILNTFFVSKQICFPILIIIETISVFLLLLNIPLPNKNVCRGVNIISRYSYTIYLTHFVVIAFGIEIGLCHLPIFVAPSILAIFTLLISVMFCYVIEKCKFVNSSIFGIQ